MCKKTFLVLGCVVGLVGLVGCGGGGDDGPADASAADARMGDGGLRIIDSSMMTVDSSSDPDGCGPHGETDVQFGGCICDDGYYDYGLAGTCVLPPACAGADDALEQNDSETMPTPWTPATVTNMLRICPADEDWFAIPLTVGQTVTVNVSFTSGPSSDLDAYLFAPGADPVNDAPVEYSDETTSPEMFTYTAAAGGDYLLVITGYEASQAQYALTITRTP